MPGQCGEEGTAQCTAGAGGAPGKAPASPPSLPKGGSEALAESTLTYFDLYTNQLFSQSTCAELYCVLMFLFRREVYLAIIINKWIFFSEVTGTCFSPLLLEVPFHKEVPTSLPCHIQDSFLSGTTRQPQST